MKYLYPYECEKKHLSTPAELQAAIDGNRREGRRTSYGQFESQMQQQLQMVSQWAFHCELLVDQISVSLRCNGHRFPTVSNKCRHYHWWRTEDRIRTDWWAHRRLDSCLAWFHMKSSSECLNISNSYKHQKTLNVSRTGTRWCWLEIFRNSFFVTRSSKSRCVARGS